MYSTSKLSQKFNPVSKKLHIFTRRHIQLYHVDSLIHLTLGPPIPPLLIVQKLSILVFYFKIISEIQPYPHKTTYLYWWAPHSYTMWFSYTFNIGTTYTSIMNRTINIKICILLQNYTSNSARPQKLRISTGGPHTAIPCWFSYTFYIGTIYTSIFNRTKIIKICILLQNYTRNSTLPSKTTYLSW